MTRILPSLLSALLLGVLPAYAETPEEKGLAIAVEADKRDTGWGAFTATMTMVLHNQHGQHSDREMHFQTLEGAAQGEGDKTIMVFDEPKDVQGTALLTHTHKTGPDDQWLFLPALKRVKRIASRNKSGPFVGSEFAYEDLTSQEVEKYTYKFLREEKCGEVMCFVNERDPVDEYSGYTVQHVWIDQQHYRPMKIDFYDRKNVLLKTLTFTGYQRYLDNYWRADKLDMVNKQTGKRTELNWRDYQFGVQLQDSDFTKNALKRAR